MKPWIKTTLSAVCIAWLAGCAITPGGDADTPPEKPVLPADYAAALALLKQGKWAPAEQALLRYAELHPRMSSPQVNLALLYLRTGRKDEARRALAKALEINPRQAAAHNQLGILAREDGDFSAARKAYKAAISAQKNYPNAHLNLAILLDLYLHDPKAALPHYQRYAELIGEDQMDQQTKSWIADAQRQVEGGK